MTIRIGINGFGRTGRALLRTIRQNYSDTLEVAAVNGPDPTDIKAHLLKWDNIYRMFDAGVEIEGNTMIVDGEPVLSFTESDPANVPWRKGKVDIIIDTAGSSTGRSLLKNGVKKVIVAAPKDDLPVIILGVNETDYDPEKDHLVSMASPASNCAALLVKVLDDRFGIVRAGLTDIHAAANERNVSDDARLIRSGQGNIIPSPSEVPGMVARILPELEGKIDGITIQVPAQAVSIIEVTAELRQDVTVEAVNEVFFDVSGGELFGILEYSEEELVSSDFIGNTASTIFDLKCTSVIDGRLVKILAWYDNEWGYACRLAELADFIGSQGL